MTTPSTAQLDALGVVCASLQTANSLKPSAVANSKHVKVRAAVQECLEAWATAFDMSFNDLAALVEASDGYTETGGTGALCS